MLALLFSCAACVTPPVEGARPATPVDAAVAGALSAGEIAHGATKETVYAWHLEVVGDRARYFACSAADACTFRAVEIPARSLAATEVVGRTRPSRGDGAQGDEVDVIRLTVTHDLETKRGGVSADARGLVVQ